MKKLFLILFLVTPVFGISNPQGESLTGTVGQVLSNSVVIQINATNIIRASSPVTRPIPELTYFKVSSPTPITRVPFSALNCAGTLCNNTESRTLTGLVCDTEYQGRISVRSANPSSASVLLEETLPIFKTRPCAQLTTAIKQVNSTKTSITGTIEVDTQGTIAGVTDFIFLLTATKEGESPVSSTEVRKQVTIALGGASTKTTGDVEINNLECDTEYSIIGTSKTNGRNNTPSEEQNITTSTCDPSTGTGTGESETTGDNVYTFLTPLPLGENLDTVPSVVIGAAGDGGILGVLQRIFTIMLVAAIVLAVVYLIIGGARYATGDSLGSKMGGKEIIFNAIKGLLFALLAWLLLNIVNPDLLRFTLSLQNITKPLTQGEGPGPDGGGESPCGEEVSHEECFDQITADEDSKIAALNTANIDINKDPCPSYGASNCTNVGLLNASTLAKIIEVKNDCVSANPACAVMITGGTEYWKHEEGGSHSDFVAVDLRLTGAEIFNGFIRSKQNAGTSSYCNARFDYKGLRFCDEKGGDAHWHVAPPTSGGGGTTGDPALFTFPHLNIRGYVVPGTGSVYGPGEISSKLTNSAMTALRPRITAAANSREINPQLFYALIAQESAGNAQAGSPAGACGVAQLLPGTARPLDPSLAGLSDAAVCTELKNNVDLSLRIGARYLASGTGSDKDKLARYNGGPGALEPSNDCPTRKRYECPWDAPGYYNQANPVGEPLKALENRSHINTGFSETRFYVINILNMAAQ